MRVKHEDICREFLVNMLRVSRFFRPAFDRHVSRNTETAKHLPSCNWFKAMFFWIHLLKKAQTRIVDSPSGFPESFDRSPDHIVHPREAVTRIANGMSQCFLQE